MSDRLDWQYNRQTRRRPDLPTIRIGDGMAVVSNPRPLTGSGCDAWQYDLAVHPMYDSGSTAGRPEGLRCLDCGEYTGECPHG